MKYLFLLLLLLASSCTLYEAHITLPDGSNLSVSDNGGFLVGRASKFDISQERLMDDNSLVRTTLSRNSDEKVDAQARMMELLFQMALKNATTPIPQKGATMPVKLNTQYQPALSPDIEKIDYAYPSNLDFSPTSKLHQKLASAILQNANDSYSYISQRHASWDSVNAMLNAYVTPESPLLDDGGRDVRRNTQEYQESTIVIPTSFAILDVMLTYLSSVFFTNPIFKYAPASPNDVKGAFLLEKVIERQTLRFATALNLHTQWRDSLVCGFGAVMPYWDTVYRKKPVKKDTPTSIITEYVDQVSFEGNSITNIDPFCFLPDPSVPIQNLKGARFAGWCVRESKFGLIVDETRDSSLFNCKYLTKISGTSNICSNIFTRNIEEGYNVDDIVDVIYMYISIIPSEVGISDSDTPERWLVALAGDCVIISAKKLDSYYDEFPINIIAPDTDGYSLSPFSRLEINRGMQNTMNWLFSSHMANIKKMVYGQFIVDPLKIHIPDLTDPSHGKIIRLRPNAWGSGVENAIKQVEVKDVTSQHIADSMFVNELMQRTTGASESLQGVRQRTGERVSASEANNIFDFSISRLWKLSNIIALQGIVPLARMFAYNTQLYQSQDSFIKLTSDWEKQQFSNGEEWLSVGIDDINVDFDIDVSYSNVHHDADRQVWLELFKMISEQPVLSQQFDITKIFKQIATMSKVKNLEDFMIQVQQPEQVQQQVQAGNLIPLQQGGEQYGQAPSPDNYY